MQSDDILDDYAFHDQPDWAGEGEVVAKFYSSLEAEVAAARLRAEGIHCFLANVIVQSVTPHLPGIIRLHTHPSDAELARDILQEASIETDGPLSRKNSGVGALLALAILIGLLLAWLLVQSLGMN